MHLKTRVYGTCTSLILMQALRWKEKRSLYVTHFSHSCLVSGLDGDMYTLWLKNSWGIKL